MVVPVPVPWFPGFASMKRSGQVLGRTPHPPCALCVVNKASQRSVLELKGELQDEHGDGFVDSPADSHI